jgi:hypothetical protein
MRRFYSREGCDGSIRGRSIWLVTHLSFDRLHKLAALCRAWRGPLAAAVWLPPSCRGAQKRRHLDELRAFERAVNAHDSGYQCTLKLACAENYKGKTFLSKWFKRTNDSGNEIALTTEGTSPGSHSYLESFGESVLRSDLYPINAVRASAVDIVCDCLGARVEELGRETLVIILDVDMHPPQLLCSRLSADTLASARVADKLVDALFDLCSQQGKFVVLPALELCDSAEYKVGEGDVSSVLGAVGAQEMKDLLLGLRGRGNLRAFHESSFIAGHSATKLDLWFQNVKESYCLENVSDLLCEPLSYEEGYEPYGVMSLRRYIEVGGFNRCFVGWHRDKIEFFKRCEAHKVDLCVLTDASAFVLDWEPHEWCESRAVTATDVLHVAAMEVCY